jgi:hypothetical protein
MFSAAGMQAHSQTQVSADSPSLVGPQYTPGIVDGTERTAVGEAIAQRPDSNTPGASKMHTPASVGVTTVGVAGHVNESRGESATSTSDLTHNTTSVDSHMKGQDESSVQDLDSSSYDQEINRALYGDDDVPPSPLPFPMFFGGNFDFDPGVFPRIEQERDHDTSVTSTEPAEFDFERCINLDP